MDNLNLKIEYIDVDKLTPYERNTRKHTDKDIDIIAKSIEKYGFNDAIGIWGKNATVVEGHGRLLAAKKLGMDKVPCVRLDHLTEQERREYAIAHNRSAEMSEWDYDFLPEEYEELDFEGFDFGFDFDLDDGSDFFENRDRNDKSREDGNDEYNEFLDKFEPKKTTDDCYTPDIVYKAVSDWVSNEYSLDSKNFVRPFYPGGDYQKYKYAENAVVVDNPPFSILAEIIKFYSENNIKFFLFAPTFTLFSSSSSSCALCVGCNVTYENGAIVCTSFLTNLEHYRLRSAPPLYMAIKAANDENLKQMKKELPKYEYPYYVLTSPKCALFSKYGIDFKVPYSESYRIRMLDAQKESGDAIYGSGYLLSEHMKAEREKAEREKAEREKAEREKAIVWKLSEREMEIVKSLSGKKAVLIND